MCTISGLAIVSVQMFPPSFRASSSLLLPSTLVNSVPSSCSFLSLILLQAQQDMADSIIPDVPRPNFTAIYAVLLDHPLSEVFPVLATSEGCERVTRLSALCTEFKLDRRDDVAIPASTLLADAHVRTLPAATAADQSQVRTLPRQFFELVEMVPILFGIITTKVSLSGTLTWDDNEKVALYETRSNQGILVRKLRRFEEVVGKHGNKQTKVEETIEGSCPGWMKMIVQSEARKAHKCVISSSIYLLLNSNIFDSAGCIWNDTTHFLIPRISVNLAGRALSRQAGETRLYDLISFCIPSISFTAGIYPDFTNSSQQRFHRMRAF